MGSRGEALRAYRSVLKEVVRRRHPHATAISRDSDTRRRSLRSIPLHLHHDCPGQAQLSRRLKGTGEYDKFFVDGVYNCVGYGTPLYKSATKFNFGWSFQGMTNECMGVMKLSCVMSSLYVIWL